MWAPYYIARGKLRMSLLAVPLIATTALILVILLAGHYFLRMSKLAKQINILSAQIQSNELQISELQSANMQLQTTIDNFKQKSETDITECIQVSRQLEHRVKTLHSQFNQQQQDIVKLQESEGQDKFYARAYKLAERGADVDEIVAECDLPRAEVEMLLSVYRRRISE